MTAHTASRRSRRPRRAGFTLMEILLVLAILVILGSVVVMNFGNIMGSAEEDTTQTQLNNIAQAIATFEIHMGRLPTDLNELNQKPSQIPRGRKWAGPYFKDEQIPTDSWGNQVQYTVKENKTYELRSGGKDGQVGGEDDVVVNK